MTAKVFNGSSRHKFGKTKYPTYTLREGNDMKITYLLLQSKPYILSLLVGILLCGTANAASTYHVSKSGNDSNSCSQAQSGTNNQAKKTIQAGAGCLSSGDTLIVSAGTYVETLSNAIPGGSSWSTVTTLKAKPGDNVIIRGQSGQSRVLSFNGAAQKYIVVDGFIIDATDVGFNAAKITGSTGNMAHHIRIQNSEIKNSKSSGIITGTGSNGNMFINLKAHHNGHVDFSGSTSTAAYSYAVYINGSNNIIDGCTIWAQGSWGVHIYNGYDGNSNNNIVRNNRIYGNGVKKSEAGGIIIGAGSGNLVYNNIVYNHPAMGIRLSRSTKAFNNTIYNNGNMAIQLAYTGGSSEVRNNILWKNGTDAVVNQGTGTPATSNNLTTDPKFVDVNKFDFRIGSSSPAIDEGQNLSSFFDFDFLGTSSKRDSDFDIGAYEFHGSGGDTNPPTAPANLRIVSN